MLKCCVGLLVFVFMHPSLCAQIKYPVTQKVNQTDQYHGVRVDDPYRWLENDTSVATSEWVEQQNQLTSEYLEGIPFRHDVRKRMAQFFNYPRYGVPFRNNNHYYYFKNSGLQNQPVLYRHLITDTTPELVLDPNTLSNDGTVQIVEVTLSKDGKYAAWGISEAGSDWQTFFVRDLRTMKDLTDTIRWVKISDIAWQGNGFFYSRYPAPEKNNELSSMNTDHQVWYHKAGTSQSGDRLIYRDSTHPYRFYSASTSEDERFVFLSYSDRGSGKLGNALYYSDRHSSDSSFKPIVQEAGEYIYGIVDPVDDGKFLIQTNDHAPNSRIILFDPKNPAKENWKTIVPEKKEPLKLASVAGNKLFLQYLKDVAAKVYVYNTAGKLENEIALPGLGTTSGFQGKTNDSIVFFEFNSFNYPPHIYQYHIRSKKTSLYRKPSVPFDPEKYLTTQLFFTSKDGTKVPMFMVHKKGIRKNGKNPTMLYGYGGFNITLEPRFNNSLMPWLEQGGIYVLVNLRGGGEYGEAWHKAGMLEKKQKVFDDFITAAEFLIRKKYTSSERLAIRGASNGGLLIGAVINQRPELFKVAVPEVGVMDMLRFQKFTIGWNWIAEYGTSEHEEDFKYLYRYSPLHNIAKDKEYPATLIITADHDDRVVPAHSFKYTATLQEKYNGKNPILLKIDTNSGHGLSSIRKNIELASDIYSFTFYNMGIQWQEIEQPAQ